MPNDMKNLLALLIALICAATASAQPISRWIKLPRHSVATTENSPLANGAIQGTLLRFNFETEPVKPLMRTIKRSFPEAAPSEEIPVESFDLGRSTIIMEELFKEAQETLINPDIALQGLPEPKKPEVVPVATLSEDIAPVTAEASTSLVLIGQDESQQADTTVNDAGLNP